MPRQPRAQRTRQRILAAAATVFSERGYDGTTTRVVAETAGVATGSVYRYFCDKAALLRELSRARMAEAHAKTLAAVAQVPEQRPTDTMLRRQLAHVVHGVVEYHCEDWALHQVIAQRRICDAELDAITVAAEEALIGNIASLLERWGLRGDAAATAFVLFGMVEGTVHAFVARKFASPQPDPLLQSNRIDDALSEALTNIILGGCHGIDSTER